MDIARIPTEEMKKDYADNERDIQMFNLMIEGNWSYVDHPTIKLASCLNMKKIMDDELKKRAEEEYRERIE